MSLGFWKVQDATIDATIWSVLERERDTTVDGNNLSKKVLRIVVSLINTQNPRRLQQIFEVVYREITCLDLMKTDYHERRITEPVGIAEIESGTK